MEDRQRVLHQPLRARWPWTRNARGPWPWPWRARERPHFGRVAFRTPRKTFATLGVAARDLNLMFDPELRDFYCGQEPAMFAPVPGGWGRMGATRCDLDAVDEPTLVSALRAAHRLAAPRPASSRRSAHSASAKR